MRAINRPMRPPTLEPDQAPSIPRTFPRQALLVLNRNSRSGEAYLDEVRDRLGSAGFQVTHLCFDDKERLVREIAARATEADCVIAAGGDGTANMVARALLARDLPLGIIPLGTANDLARTLGIPMGIDEAIHIIAAGHTRRIDIGLVNGHPFFNVASLGLSAELAATLTTEVKRRFGRFGYALTTVRVLLRARPFRVRITTEQGVVTARTLQIAVGNGRYYGGGNAVAQDAAIDDGQLDLYSLEFYRAWKLALLARSFREGTHGRADGVRALSGRSFLVETRRSLPVNADGELVTRTPARFELLRQRMTVFAPAEPPPEAGLSG